MTTIRVVIPVDLDTAAAKAKMRDLDKVKDSTKRQARSQVWRKIRARVGMTMGAAAGYSQVTSVARMHSGPVDPWAAALKPAEAAVQQYVDKVVGFSAEGRRRARAEVIAKTAYAVGHGASVAGAIDLFGTVNTLREQEESGRNIVRQVLHGPTFEELAEQAIKGYYALLERAFFYVYDGIVS